MRMELWRLDLGQRPRAGADLRRRGQRRTAAVARRQAASPGCRPQGTGHFNLFVADIDADGLHNARPLLGERKSALDRYYYSAFDHAINPSWSPDGKRIVFVGNPEVAWGTGDIWSVPVADPAQRRKVLARGNQLERAPRTRAGRQAPAVRQLPRPPDAPAVADDAAGRRAAAADLRRRRTPQCALVARRPAHRLHRQRDADGNTALGVMDVVGGATPRGRRRAAPHPSADRARLTLDIGDGARQAHAGARGRARQRRPRACAGDAWMHADDGFDRARAAHRDALLPLRIAVHAGRAGGRHRGVRAARLRPCDRGGRRIAGGGRAATRDPRATAGATRLPAEFGDWISADLHVHMNYGGHYRNTPRAPRAAGAGRGPRRRRQPDRQQGRAHSRHRLRSAPTRPRQRAARACCMRRSTTPASGATWACSTCATTTSRPTSPPTATPRWPARIRTTA